MVGNNNLIGIHASLGRLRFTAFGHWCGTPKRTSRVHPASRSTLPGGNLQLAQHIRIAGSMQLQLALRDGIVNGSGCSLQPLSLAIAWEPGSLGVEWELDIEMHILISIGEVSDSLYSVQLGVQDVAS